MRQAEGRMRRHGLQTSPERARPWTEPPTKPPLQQQQGRKVPVVYYLCKNRHLEHPHFIEVPLSSPDGLYLGDVIDRLNVLRGKGMAAMYSWSCKRGYKNGFVWHDLGEDDLILPAQGNEYVLKGSELLDQSPPDRNLNGVINPRMQNLKRPQQEPSVNSCKDQEAVSSSLSSKAIAINEAKTSPSLPSPASPPPPPPLARQDELSPSTNRSSSSGNFSPEPGSRTAPSSAMGSPSLVEYRVNKPVTLQDASTQTDERGGRKECVSDARIAGVSMEDVPLDMESSERQNGVMPCLKEEPEIVREERSPPLTVSNASSSSCERTSTLESLIRDELNQRTDFRIVEEEEVFVPTRAKLKATDMLVQLITCGSISVKDHYNFGIVPTYKPTFTNMKSPSPMFSGSMVLGEIDCLSESQRAMRLRLEEKKNFSGTIAETKNYKEETNEGSLIPKNSCFEEEGSCKTPDAGQDKERVTDSVQLKCLSRAIKIASCRQSRNETMRSPASGTRMYSEGTDSTKSSPLSSSKVGSKRITDNTSAKSSLISLESFREEKEKVNKIDES